MKKECAPCFIFDGGRQGVWDESKVLTEYFLLYYLSFIADSQLLRIAVARAYKGRSETLTTRVSPEVTLGSCQ